MLGVENLIAFIGTGILLNLYPGPDTFSIAGRSISQGRKAGIYAALGIATGAVVHNIVGTLGLSVIFATSAHAFLIIKYIGAAYLVYQGFSMLFSKVSVAKELEVSKVSVDVQRIFRQGALTNILNPKVAVSVFFMAFIPQFISADSPNKGLTFLFLGFVFITTGTIWCLLIALFSSILSRRIRRNTSISRYLLRMNGALLTALGLKLATSKFNA